MPLLANITHIQPDYYWMKEEVDQGRIEVQIICIRPNNDRVDRDEENQLPISDLEIQWFGDDRTTELADLKKKAGNRITLEPVPPPF